MSTIWSGPSRRPSATWPGSRLTGCSRLRSLLFTIPILLFPVGVPAQDTPHRLAPDPALEYNVSPYVAKHSGEPIFWRSLEPESFELARTLGRPVLISSGYLSCYWCHRMAKDSFADPDLAEYVNTHFVPVVMDREVHVEEDRSLQDFMQETRGISGWPATVILTPEGYPVFGYAYTDPTSMRTSLAEFIEAWSRSPSVLSDSARADSERRRNDRSSRDMPVEGLRTLDLLLGFLEQTNAASDPEFGGFGSAAKFPFVPQMAALVELSALNPDPGVMTFIAATLDAMLDSAIVDPIEGGVFRYSETRSWDTPHFEQMLYSQALVGRLFLRASAVLASDRYRDAGFRVLDHMARSFRLENGWYASSLSSVSEDGIDGGYYLWTPEELREVLGPDWKEKVDDRLPGRAAILAAPASGANGVRSALLERRTSRERIRDDKPVLGWNGLVLSAMAYGAALDSRFVRYAEELARQAMLETRDLAAPVVAGDGGKEMSTLESYVQVAGGLIDWWQLSGDRDVLERVRDLLAESLSRFRENGRWMEARALLPEAGMARIAIADRQISSPSGEWYRLAAMLLAVDPGMADPLRRTVEEMEAVQSRLMREEAFYHATFILARLMRSMAERS
ncbi:MAG: thioredoxin domain-containing protein [Gammaproteobacteria bacterium]|nr:thioredoxin domain-containing protein [Gammaproteobacteria bacterium]MYD75369.1 thioredoxin domain-containing protein [Gammaproteobacteria bacterium]MYJ52663.1 thioredoxin domain-containing protein [Gammaproteobacteria bacterium]